jgi:hypothetical protein
MKKFLLMFAVAVMSVSMASATTIGDLVGTTADNGFVVGDKVFYGFSCEISTGGGASYTCADVNNWDVAAINGPDYGLNFTTNLVVSSGFIDVDLSFYVKSLAGSPIPGIGLGFTPSVSGAGYAKISETAVDQGDLANVGTALVQKLGPFNDLTDPPGESADVLVLGHTAQILKITKDILVQACLGPCSTADLNIAGITNFEQTFPQIGENNVPEPGTYAMMGAGLLALAAIRRRKA